MRTLNLALQGGGSHGAFTWGVLDALLADERISLEGLSGTSAGAVNAVALASGYARAWRPWPKPRRHARESLARYGAKSRHWAAWGAATNGWLQCCGAACPPSCAHQHHQETLARPVFPLPVEPAGHRSAARLLEREIDFEAIAAHRTSSRSSFPPRMCGPAGPSSSAAGAHAQAVMASACLPMLFKAVEIDGEHYWDGGYSVIRPCRP